MAAQTREQVKTRVKGKAPFGYRRSHGRFVRGPKSEREAVQGLFNIALSTGLGCTALARSINETSLPSPGGADIPWTAKSVNRILRNPIYCGLVVPQKQEHGKSLPMNIASAPQGDHPALVSQEVWEHVQTLLDNRNPRKQRKRHNQRYVLSGIAKCANCGSALIGVTRKNGKHRYYICSKAFRKADACAFRYIPCGHLEMHVLNRVLPKLRGRKNRLNWMSRKNEDAKTRFRLQEQVQSVEALIDVLSGQVAELAVKPLRRIIGLLVDEIIVDSPNSKVGVGFHRWENDRILAALKET